MIHGKLSKKKIRWPGSSLHIESLALSRLVGYVHGGVADFQRLIADEWRELQKKFTPKWERSDSIWSTESVSGFCQEIRFLQSQLLRTSYSLFGASCHRQAMILGDCESHHLLRVVFSCTDRFRSWSLSQFVESKVKQGHMNEGCAARRGLCIEMSKEGLRDALHGCRWGLQGVGGGDARAGFTQAQRPNSAVESSPEDVVQLSSAICEIFAHLGFGLSSNVLELQVCPLIRECDVSSSDSLGCSISEPSN
jgi:hypothetical protein